MRAASTHSFTGRSTGRRHTRLQAVRVYDAAAGTLQGTFVHGAPVLDAVFENDGVVYTGGLDNAVKR